MTDNTTSFYNCFTSTVDPTANDDETLNFYVGSRWANTLTNRLFACVSAATANAVWICITVPNSPFDHLSVFPSPIMSLSYQFVASIPFVGTQDVNLSTINVAAQILGSPPSGHTFDIRVLDATNGNALVAEAVGLHSTTKVLFDLGALNNLPIANAVFDIELRRSGTMSANAAVIYAVLLKFA